MRYFVAVAERLSFTRAAEELETAQPSLSQQIRALEAELGVRLFERTRRHVALTEEGRSLLPEARAILERVDALATLGDRSLAPRGPLRIASITASTIAILPKILASYRKRYPDVEVSVETAEIEQHARALVERRVDVAFLRLPIADARLDSVLAAREDLCLAVPNGHPLAARKRIPLRALNGLDIVAIRDREAGGFNEEILALLQREGVVARSRVETARIETLLGLVASGMGVAVASAALRSMRFSGVTLRPIQPRWTVRSLSLAWRRDRGDVATIRTFREHLVAYAIACKAPNA